MNEKRATSSGRGSSTKTSRVGSKRVVAKRGDGAIDAAEEKVVRMRKGLAAPDDLELERVGQKFPATRAKLEEIEARALSRSGRLDELRKEVGLPVARSDAATKEKIITRLAAKNTKSKKPAKVKASVKATVKPKARR
jgi:hypothetical protein